jgi:GNAT superfamily N-acetyltransferase
VCALTPDRLLVHEPYHRLRYVWSVLVPSHAAKLSMWDLVVGGMWQVPFRFGWATLQRLMALLNAMEGAVGKVKQPGGETDHEFVMLQRMVVLPQCQGKGVGNRALRAILSLNEENGSNVHLDTQEERNVRFYERLGWRVTGDHDLFEDDDEYKFHSWQMVHQRTS